MNDDVIKLLLVEDNRALAHLMEKMMGRVRDIHFRCHLAASLAEVSSVLPGGQFDVVLLDLELPDSKGLLTLEKVNALRPDLPVVVLTAREEEDMASKALRSGAQDYLIKGAVDRRHLVRALLYAIERKRGEEARARLAAAVNSSQNQWERAQREREDLMERLQTALAEVRTLSALLPICACCKRVRDEEEYRAQVEAYLKEHSGAISTQAICPHCSGEYQPSCSAGTG